MAEFLNTRMIAGQIDKLIANAEKRVVLISPYLQMESLVIERMTQASKRGVQVEVVYGKRDLQQDQQRILDGIPSLKLRFCESLHAKCYFNEQMLIISSLNLYEYSVQNNFEMGVLVRADEQVYADAVREAETIIAASKLERSGGAFGRLLGSAASFASETAKTARSAARSVFAAPQKDEGHCVRCADAVPLNPYKPLCSECFDKWRQYGNWDYPEKYCHDCGQPSRTSAKRPLCDRCYG